MSCNITVPASYCTAANIATPVVFGAEILSYNHPTIDVKSVDFCNVTVTYTHPGMGDTVSVATWLPLDTWNGRFQSVGGGGWNAGSFFLSNIGMAGALGEGYAAGSSNAGLPPNVFTPETWALLSPGNVNLQLLEDFGSVALNDQSVIQSFYGKPPKYSYWSGCSQGGRQGLMLAQRYPEAYDGIAAAAPAIYWPQFFAGSSWAQFMMNSLDTHPFKCEIDAITAAAVTYCDPLDGITDSIISDAEACAFDPFSVVGQVVSNCTQTGTDISVSEGAATIVNATWTGPRGADGRFLWFGPDYQSRLTGASDPTGTTSDTGYAMTSCNANGTCVGIDAGLGSYWFQYFVEKNASWALSDIKTVEEYQRLFHTGVQVYDSFVGTGDPDLSEFRSNGGKLITYHGLADGLIPSRGTTYYYDQVLELDPVAQDFYRYFQVPGLGHCSGGSGGTPTATWQALVDWVEKGVAPDTIPITFNDTDGVKHNRILCPYPEKARLKDGCLAVTEADCFECVA